MWLRRATRPVAARTYMERVRGGYEVNWDEIRAYVISRVAAHKPSGAAATVTLCSSAGGGWSRGTWAPCGGPSRCHPTGLTAWACPRTTFHLGCDNLTTVPR